MKEEWVTIRTRDGGAMEGYLVESDCGRQRPMILLLQEIFGVNEAMRDAARDFAGEGFEVLVPDLFWRAEPRISLDYLQGARAKELMLGFDNALGLSDIEHAVAWARQRQRTNAGIAAVGFCLGGLLATLLAARGTVDHGVAFYGVQLADHVDEIARAKSPLLFHFGALDGQNPPELIGRIKTAAARNPRIDIHVHPDAMHGFYNRLRPERHNPVATAKSRALTLQALQHRLGTDA
jgi:carboxymethylenebutenolidase